MITTVHLGDNSTQTTVDTEIQQLINRFPQPVFLDVNVKTVGEDFKVFFQQHSAEKAWNQRTNDVTYKSAGDRTMVQNLTLDDIDRNLGYAEARYGDSVISRVAVTFINGGTFIINRVFIGECMRYSGFTDELYLRVYVNGQVFDYSTYNLIVYRPRCERLRTIAFVYTRFDCQYLEKGDVPKTRCSRLMWNFPTKKDVIPKIGLRVLCNHTLDHAVLPSICEKYEFSMCDGPNTHVGYLVDHLPPKSIARCLVKHGAEGYSIVAIHDSIANAGNFVSIFREDIDQMKLTFMKMQLKYTNNKGRRTATYNIQRMESYVKQHINGFNVSLECVDRNRPLEVQQVLDKRAYRRFVKDNSVSANDTAKVRINKSELRKLFYGERLVDGEKYYDTRDYLVGPQIMTRSQFVPPLKVKVDRMGTPELFLAHVSLNYSKEYTCGYTEEDYTLEERCKMSGIVMERYNFRYGDLYQTVEGLMMRVVEPGAKYYDYDLRVTGLTAFEFPYGRLRCSCARMSKFYDEVHYLYFVLVHRELYKEHSGQFYITNMVMRLIFDSIHKCLEARYPTEPSLFNTMTRYKCHCPPGICTRAHYCYHTYQKWKERLEYKS